MFYIDIGGSADTLKYIKHHWQFHNVYQIAEPYNMASKK
jgi:hypothetical protein